MIRTPRNFRFPNNNIKPVLLPVENDIVLFNGKNISQILSLVYKAKLMSNGIKLPNGVFLMDNDKLNIKTLEIIQV